MPNYQNGKIYKIIDVGYTKCYIGSTVESLSTRMSHHRATFKTISNSSCSSVLMFEEFGLDNCKIELIENFPCNNKEELHAREGFHIQHNDCINKVVPGRSRKEYREQNKEILSKVNKQYRTNNESMVKEREQNIPRKE